MVEIQRAVLKVLLDVLHEQELVDDHAYDSAGSLLHSVTNLPEFFWCPLRCREKEGEDDECTQDP